MEVRLKLQYVLLKIELYFGVMRNYYFLLI